MTERGEEKLEGIQQDLACPGCEYNLRGLRGEVVICPECGGRVDVARLINKRWTGPLFNVPGYSRILVPVAWLVIGAQLTSLPLVFELSRNLVPGLTVICIMAVIFGWLCLMFGLARFMPRGRAIWLALFAHALFAGYAAGVAGIAWLVAAMFFSTTNLWRVVLLLLIPVCGGLLYLCRRGENYIARQCIRRYLQRQACG